jgi:hypothetical protein
MGALAACAAEVSPLDAWSDFPEHAVLTASAPKATSKAAALAPLNLTIWATLARKRLRIEAS